MSFIKPIDPPKEEEEEEENNGDEIKEENMEVAQ